MSLVIRPDFISRGGFLHYTQRIAVSLLIKQRTVYVYLQSCLDEKLLRSPRLQLPPSTT